MVKTVKRRQSDPSAVLQLWEAITCIRQQKQVANLDRIFRFVERSYGVPSKDCQRQINLAVKDNLLVKEISRSNKGSKVGITQDGFWCAEERTEESEEPHDWYCFSCHKGGDVLCCGTCHRVYHPECVEVEDPEKIFGLWICPICENCRKKSGHKWDLNKMLWHVANRMKEKARELTKKLNLDELPNYFNLVYQHMDLTIMMEKLSEKKYRSVEEFKGDAESLVHVAFVYHGADSERAKLTEDVLRDCLHDLSEIKLCRDCYIMSNDRTQKDWFCQPCSPPHELVWAQMTGFGYWPAKVLQRNEDKVDVRFFGTRHERAWIESIHIRDIKTDRKKLKLKQSQGWRKAVTELGKYEKNLENANKLETSVISVKTVNALKRKHTSKKAKGDEEGSMTEEEEMKDGKEEEEEEGEEELKGEARHIVRSSSTTDAGQDQSVSTSQISPESLDEPPSKKQKSAPATPATPSLSKEESQDSQDMETVENENDAEDLPPPLPLEEKDKDDDGEEEGTKEETMELKEEEKTEEVKEKVKEEVKEEKKKEIKDKQKEKKADERKQVKEGRKAEEKKEQLTPVVSETEHKKKLDKAIKDALEKAKKEWQSEKERLLKEAGEKLASEIEKTRTETETNLKKEHHNEIQKLKDEISQTKKKQWCINCEKEAMYHCCWNTSYCSINCQQVHWHQEHKRLCRRKR